MKRADVIMIAVTVALLLGVGALHWRKQRDQARQAGCNNNLKIITLSFRVWAGDATARFPMSVSVTKGGTKELITSGSVFPHFQVMSNELHSTKILVCPEDRERSPAADFGTGFTDRNISYFIGVDATDANPQMFLTGDRNLAVNGLPAGHGIVPVSRNQIINWTPRFHQGKGNLGLTDGSVQMLPSDGLNVALRFSGVETNRLAMP